MHLEFDSSPNQFNGITMYYPKSDTETFNIGPYQCPFGITQYYGKNEMVVSVSNDSDIANFQKIDKIVDEFAEENEFPVNGRCSLNTPKNPEYQPTLKLKINKNTVFYDENNIVKDMKYVDKFDKVICEVCITCIWLNDNAYGVSYRANSVQVIKEEKKKSKGKQQKKSKYAFDDDE